MDISFLVEQAKKQDKQALLTLIMGQQDEYYRLAYVYLRNHQDAMDAVQEMTLILYDQIKKLKNSQAFYSWSKTILVNCCKKMLRQNRKLIPMEQVEEACREESGELETSLALEGYLKKLGEKYQEVIRLRYYLDLDHAAIASILKIPEGTVKSRTNTALRKLRGFMEGSDFSGY